MAILAESGVECNPATPSDADVPDIRTEAQVGDPVEGYHVPPEQSLSSPGDPLKLRPSQALLSSLNRCVDSALSWTLEQQDSRGAWLSNPEPRVFETALVSCALEKLDNDLARAALLRAQSWLEHAEPQRHDPIAELLDEAPRRALNRDPNGIDLRLPGLFSEVNRRKALLIYALARHKGVAVHLPFSEDKLLHNIRTVHVQLRSLPMKRWSRVDLISARALVELLHGHKDIAAEVAAELAPYQSDDGSFSYNPVSTALAFLVLDELMPHSLVWQRCLDYLIQSQQPDGTWRFCTSDVWDTTLMVRSWMPHPRFQREGLPRALRFLADAQNPDGGWGFRTGVESDNDSTGCALLALDEQPEFHDNLKRAIAYLEHLQLQDGLWTTWQAHNDPAVEDTVAHVLAALVRHQGYHTMHLEAAQRWLEQRFALRGRWTASWYRSLPYAVLEVGWAMGERHPLTRRATDALFALQNPDHGWGPEPREPSSPSATGQALAALLRFYPITLPRLRLALEYLIQQQSPDGSWPGRPEMYGPRPLLTHIPTQTQALVLRGVVDAWMQLQG